MSEPYIGEIRQTAFGIVPAGWAACNGQILPVVQNEALFSILGTTYGGDGRNTFGLPNLQGRVPVGPGDGIALGQPGGSSTHTLTTAELPAHGHPLAASTAAGSIADPEGNVVGKAKAYVPGSNAAAGLDASAVQSAGGSQPHENMAPYLTIQFVIALKGIYPSRG